MSNPRFIRTPAWLDEWFTVERQGTIIGGVLLLFALWLGKVIEPFILGVPAYAFYFVLSEPLKRAGLLGIEGSAALFWLSAVIWLYLFCATLLYLAMAIGNRYAAT